VLAVDRLKGNNRHAVLFSQLPNHNEKDSGHVASLLLNRARTARAKAHTHRARHAFLLFRAFKPLSGASIWNHLIAGVITDECGCD
jgi:hypothetical protein